jgi:endonuclease/exonuclease/phosphatase (EEP) superfamily protein YafD
VWTVLGWVVVLALGAVVLTQRFGVTGRAGLAIAQDLLVYLLTAAWVVLIVAVLGDRWVLAAVAAVLAIYQLVLVIPRLTATRLPRWTRDAPRLELLVSNVFIDNETPAALARELLGRDADVVVILEWNPTFVREFDAAGGRTSYPNRVFDPGDHSDYAVGIVAKVPLAPESQMMTIGPLRFAQAVVDVGGEPLTIIGLNPTAAVDPGGVEDWEKQLDALIDHVPSVAGPLVVAGDLNTTTYRPKVQELLAAGLVDAHESLGQGLSPSFKLAADGVLAAAGAVLRLDHALVSDGVRAVDVEDFEGEGSDHLAFVVTLAVKPGDRAQPARS